MKRLTALIRKYREAIAYLFFGGLTTLLNIAVFMGMSRLGIDTALSNSVAWLLAVLFAYLTNRRWVFESKASGKAEVAREAASFFGSRVFTGLLDTGILVLFVDVLGLHRARLIVKTASGVLVILLNYLLSKRLVFRNGRNGQD